MDEINVIYNEDMPEPMELIDGELHPLGEEHELRDSNGWLARLIRWLMP